MIVMQKRDTSEFLQASHDFNRARNRALLSRIQHFMEPDRDNLLSLEDVKGILKPRSETYQGMRVVPISKIIGSEGRYRDFNKYFLPRSEFLRNRWESVDLAKIRDIPLPAIRLYEIGGAYFVRDGNHRVSVARSIGEEQIDAEVTSLSSEVTITPSMTVEELKEELIKYEKKSFYEKTSFGSLTGDMDLDFTQPGRYDVICNHILGHKYYLNQNIRDELAFGEALVSWYKNVYRPIVDIIIEDNICLNFPGRSPGDLYVWIVRHWDSLKREHGIHYSIAAAARDFSAKYGNSKGRFFRLLAGILARVFRRSGKR